MVLDTNARLSLFDTMLTMRLFEERLVSLFDEKLFGSHFHLYIGQEATGAAVLRAMRDDDLALTTHRNHGHVVGRGADPGRAFAEILGRRDGFNGGRGGTLHLCDRSKSFLSTSAVVGGCAGLGAGAAYGLKTLGGGRVAVAFFGDGALEEGLVLESFNIAALWRLPLVYVCENNSGGAIGQAGGGYPTAVTAAKSLSRLPACYGIPTAVVDGTDVDAVYQAAAAAIDGARRGDGPSFIEAMTERWPGSQPLWPELATVTDLSEAWEGERIKGPHADWLRRHDPVLRLAREMVAAGVDPAALLEIDRRVRERLDQAVAFAKASPFPAAETATDLVFA